MVLKMEKGVWYGPQKIVMSIVLLVGVFLGVSIIVYAVLPQPVPPQSPSSAAGS
jgi:hypothetical protein